MKIIITGATGMVGEGVLLVCLQHPDVSQVLSVSRKPQAHKHAKLKELIVRDFSELEKYKTELQSYDGCLFCAGVSSIGETEATFTNKTFDFVVPFGKLLAEINPQLTFIYVSGSGTDSSEKGKVMWARVKGRTENTLSKLPFKGVYHFRPGLMKPVAGQKNVKPIFRVVTALYPVVKVLAPKWTCTLDQVGTAMLHCVEKGYTKSILEVEDIKKIGG
ncbi:MAG TPA: NAD-dependent epimerase/dehydratase family protein [Chitinophagales bacterium]|nr:NAD-dependent epimerase/dehydratase family protein [Chitinophagales bacterium]HRG28678.1 NAD-dependent epimerase/dehydratase family protein [Chitinophagales bacterium]HRG86530.1 NAD-dependent epimerase/dehydratase family protein [Chitinophagales bacterium]HRH52554.1 NAD-dependent epimerase/dehydratase family protein [Chitinophagales bacterium]